MGRMVNGVIAMACMGNMVMMKLVKVVDDLSLTRLCQLAIIPKWQVL